MGGEMGFEAAEGVLALFGIASREDQRQASGGWAGVEKLVDEVAAGSEAQTAEDDLVFVFPCWFERRGGCSVPVGSCHQNISVFIPFLILHLDFQPRRVTSYQSPQLSRQVLTVSGLLKLSNRDQYVL